MITVLDAIKIIGGLAGITALTWKLFEEFKDYLKIGVEASKEGDNYSILTVIENTSKFSKRIDNAFLIISLEESDLIETGIQIAEHLKIDSYMKNTNDFEKLTSQETVYINKCIVFVPLEFYYSENIGIGNEKLTYRCSLDKGQLDSGNYSVRFYLYGGTRYHRSTQDLIKITN